MKVAYDPTADALYLREAEDLRVEHTEEVAKGIYLDYDTEGNVVAKGKKGGHKHPYNHSLLTPFKRIAIWWQVHLSIGCSYGILQ